MHKWCCGEVSASPADYRDNSSSTTMMGYKEHTSEELVEVCCELGKAQCLVFTRSLSQKILIQGQLKLHVRSVQQQNFMFLPFLLC